MSIFRTVHMECPNCETPLSFELALSVNAGRRPEQRRAILEGSFQRETCPACATNFRVDPQFTYVDLTRRQYIGVWPQARRGEWQACAERTRAGFDAAYGRSAPADARGIGEGVAVRAVFGWPALVEKLLAVDAGIDDASLEVAKLAVLASRSEAPVPGRRELRAIRVGEKDIVVAWVDTETEAAGDALSVPRQLIADIEADPGRWQALREEVAEGVVVDFQRDMVPA
jgi:hypothetical protein